MPNYIEKIDKRNLPVVPLRGIVVFPQNLSSIELTGETALAALDAASKSDGVAFFVLQKDYSVENPKTDNLNEMGTVAKIKQTIKTNDKARRVILEGINRAVISSAEKKGALINAEVLIKWTQSDDNGGLRGEAYMREAVDAFEKLVAYKIGRAHV